MRAGGSQTISARGREVIPARVVIPIVPAELGADLRSGLEIRVKAVHQNHKNFG